MADIRDGSVNELLLARAKRQAEALINADPAEGHIALSAIAALRWDVADAEQHVNTALRYERSVGMLCNAITTFEFLNRSDLARPHAIAAITKAPSDREVARQAITSLLSGGYVRDAARWGNPFEENRETGLGWLIGHCPKRKPFCCCVWIFKKSHLYSFTSISADRLHIPKKFRAPRVQGVVLHGNYIGVEVNYELLLFL